MSVSDAQKSEVHAATADASTSPSADGDEAATRHQHGPRAPSGEVRPIQGFSPGTIIVQDDTDSGGPLVIISDDPALNPPRTPKDPFPTDGTPEIDAPIEKK